MDIPWRHRRRGRDVDIQSARLRYKMVRNLVGAAVAVAAGDLARDRLDVLLSGDASRCDNPALAAPARGLCLDEVFYDDF